MISRPIALILMCAMMCLSATAQAQSSHLDVAGGGAMWVSPEPGGNIYAMLSYQRLDGWRGMNTELLYNTDTLQLLAQNILISDALHLGGYLKVQAGAAGVLINYFQQGVSVPERAFVASYVQGALLMSMYEALLFIDLELGVRRWAFSRLPTTSERLALPPNMWTFEPRLRMTWWRFKHDQAFSERHRQTWRLQGIGAGLELGHDVRRGWRGWGAFDAQDGRSNDARNLNGRAPVLARAWLKAGHNLHDRLRVQSALFLSMGMDEDDLTRTRVGGMNPFVVSLAGMPWPAYLPDNFGAVQLSAHTPVWGAHELGVFFDTVAMRRSDALRVRHDEDQPIIWNPLSGVGVMGDFRWGQGWQADAKFGWTLPTEDTIEARPHVALWLSLGKRVF